MNNAEIIFYYKNVIMDDEEESDTDDDLEYLKVIMNAIVRTNIYRTNEFVNQVLEQFSDKQFQENFRLTRQSFEWLYNETKGYLESEGGLKPSIDPKKQLLAAIWVLGTPDSYRSIGGRFNMPKSTLFVCFERVINVLNRIAPDIIKWPTKNQRQLMGREFYKSGNISGCIGAIDGTYVAMKAPSENPDVYINRKCFHGITLQAVCGYNREFLNTFAGYPSSVSDNRIFRNSDLHNEITANPANFFDQNQFIIGDKAYPLYNWCIPPYIDRGNLTRYQRNFNTKHAKTRQVIERAFALLFGRFRRLKYLDMNRIDLIAKTIQAACVLHNICLRYNDPLLDHYAQEGTSAVCGQVNIEAEPNRNEAAIEAGLLRDQIARNLEID